MGYCIDNSLNICSSSKEIPFLYPNLEEVEEAYWFGPIRMSVTPFVGDKTREPLELGT